MIAFRPYRAEDRAALEDLHRQQVGESGAVFAFPDLDDPRYLRVYIAERDGQVVGAVIFHATVETFFVGADPTLVRATVRHRQALERDLTAAGADELHAFVPRALANKMRPLLERLGFRRSNPAFEPWYRELPSPQPIRPVLAADLQDILMNPALSEAEKESIMRTIGARG